MRQDANVSQRHFLPVSRWRRVDLRPGPLQIPGRKIRRLVRWPERRDFTPYLFVRGYDTLSLRRIALAIIALSGGLAALWLFASHHSITPGLSTNRK